jgi:hypothetical protein
MSRDSAEEHARIADEGPSTSPGVAGPGLRASSPSARGGPPQLSALEASRGPPSLKGGPAAGGDPFVRPLPFHRLPMPAKDRLWADHERGPSNPRKRPAHRGHEQEVATAKTRTATWRLDHQLVTKHHDLDVAFQIFGRVGEQSDETAQQQIHDSEEHGPKPPRAWGPCYEPAGRGNNLRVAVPFREAGSGAAK